MAAVPPPPESPRTPIRDGCFVRTEMGPSRTYGHDWRGERAEGHIEPTVHLAPADVQTTDLARRATERRQRGQPVSGSTFPVLPSTVTRIPVCSRAVASPQPTTAGIPYSRAMIEACDAAAPTSVTTAAPRLKSGVQAG